MNGSSVRIARILYHIVRCVIFIEVFVRYPTLNSELFIHLILFVRNVLGRSLLYRVFFGEICEYVNSQEERDERRRRKKLRYNNKLCTLYVVQLKWTLEALTDGTV